VKPENNNCLEMGVFSCGTYKDLAAIGGVVLYSAGTNDMYVACHDNPLLQMM